jgi:short-subunit dehydrogenase
MSQVLRKKMTVTDAGTVLITGPSGGLGRPATLEMAHRTGSARPDLLLVGRRGDYLTEVAAVARAGGQRRAVAQGHPLGFR